MIGLRVVPALAGYVVTLPAHATSLARAGRMGALRSLFTRKEIWAICITQYTQSWGMYGLVGFLMCSAGASSWDSRQAASCPAQSALA